MRCRDTTEYKFVETMMSAEELPLAKLVQMLYISIGTTAHHDDLSEHTRRYLKFESLYINPILPNSETSISSSRCDSPSNRRRRPFASRSTHIGFDTGFVELNDILRRGNVALWRRRVVSVAYK